MNFGVGTKRPITKRPKTKHPITKRPNNKTPNATKSPITKRPKLHSYIERFVIGRFGALAFFYWAFCYCLRKRSKL